MGAGWLDDMLGGTYTPAAAPESPGGGGAISLGRDTSCTTSLKTGRFVVGARLVAEAAYRRLITPRGSLRGGAAEAEYGLDLTEFCGASNPKQVAASLPGRIRAELTKDERIAPESIDVQILSVTEGPETSFDIAIYASTADGPFALQLAVSQVTVALLGIQ